MTFTQNLDILATYYPQLLTPIKNVALGLLTAVKYYERHGVHADQFDAPEPEPEKEKNQT